MAEKLSKVFSKKSSRRKGKDKGDDESPAKERKARSSDKKKLVRGFANSPEVRSVLVCGVCRTFHEMLGMYIHMLHVVGWLVGWLVLFTHAKTFNNIS